MLTLLSKKKNLGETNKYIYIITKQCDKSNIRLYRMHRRDFLNLRIQ